MDFPLSVRLKFVESYVLLDFEQLITPYEQMVKRKKLGICMLKRKKLGIRMLKRKMSGFRMLKRK